MKPLCCPLCQSSRFHVVDTRLELNGWRRRECLDCGARWSTREINLPLRGEYLHRPKFHGQMGLEF